MRDFPFWRGAIYLAKTLPALKGVEEDIANFQKEPVFNSNEPKLTGAQVRILRKMAAQKNGRISLIKGPSSQIECDTKLRWPERQRNASRK